MFRFDILSRGSFTTSRSESIVLKILRNKFVDQRLVVLIHDVQA